MRETYRKGMESHARTADDRLARHFPGESFDKGVQVAGCP
jgi:hypothetical protein